jgi:ubiquinone/menaquinone biosynthesis C-methylase UbiE
VAILDYKKEYYDKSFRHSEGIQENEDSDIYIKLSKKLNLFNMDKIQICKRMINPGITRLLDIGCEDGLLIYELMDKCEECHGIDISNVPLKRAVIMNAKNSNSKKIHFYQCDIDNGLPFQDSVFDAITCNAVLEHIFSPQLALEEIHRVLKPKGVLILQVPNIAFIKLRIQLLFGVQPRTTGGPFEREWEHLHIFTLKTLQTILQMIGYQIEETACSGPFSKIRSLDPSLLGGDIIIKCNKID